jgi:Cys-tRNA(Pro)/Cys-tRNA(Cys) deacylase
MAGSTPAIAALIKAGIDFEILEYEHDPRVRAFGDETTAVLGLDPDHVFKTLVALVDGSPAVGIVPVSGQLDLKALAAACHGRRGEMAPPELAERLTGYVLGGISPLGQKRALPCVLDEQAILLPRIYVSGGRRGLTLCLSPDDLVSAVNGAIAPIARAERG